MNLPRHRRSQGGGAKPPPQLKCHQQRWSPRGRPWTRSLKSSKISLSSARGQHHFFNRQNFVGKQQKPRGKLCEDLFCFHRLEIA